MREPCPEGVVPELPDRLLEKNFYRLCGGTYAFASGFNVPLEAGSEGKGL